jgi:hypothetical protein
MVLEYRVNGNQKLTQPGGVPLTPFRKVIDGGVAKTLDDQNG